MDTITCPNCEEPMLIHEAEHDDEPVMAECPDCGYLEEVRPPERADNA